ncbi:hypothetical protein Bca4012_074971 [Brassica carinata]
MRNKTKELEVKMAETSLTKKEAMKENESESTCPDMKLRVPVSKSFSSFNFMTIINLSYTNLENEGAIALVNALENSAPSLKAIEVAGNNITYEAAPDISACLAAKRHLKRLNLSNNDLKDEGCFEIAYIMEPLEVKYVDMSNNNLTREGALSLALVAVKKEGFEMLNIDGNTISFEGIEEIMEIFKNCPKDFLLLHQTCSVTLLPSPLLIHSLKHPKLIFTTCGKPVYLSLIRDLILE